jgi:hypothetical protein
MQLELCEKLLRDCSTFYIGFENFYHDEAMINDLTKVMALLQQRVVWIRQFKG